LKKVKAAALEWHLWARARGESVKPPSRVLVVPMEVMHVTYNPVDAGKPEPLFWSETLPVSKGDISKTLRLMEHSRSDLLELCSGLDRKVVRWKPRVEPRTIGNCLRHIAIVEWWYVTRLNIDLPRDFPQDVFRLLQYTRLLAVKRLSKLSKEERTGVFQPTNDPSPISNLWTARKVLRRFVDHERLHTNYIRRLIQLYESSD